MAGKTKDPLLKAKKAKAVEIARETDRSYSAVLADILTGKISMDEAPKPIIDNPVGIVDNSKTVSATKRDEGCPADTGAGARPLEDRMGDAIEAAMQALTPERIRAQTAAGIATTMAILVDKRRLIMGDPTANLQLTIKGSEDFIKALSSKGKSAKMSENKAT